MSKDTYQNLRRVLAVIDTAEMPNPNHCGGIDLAWRREDLFLTLRGDEFGYHLELECGNSNGKIFHKSDYPTDAELCKWLLWIKGE